ncbi:MAG TPA: hypothetical protein HA348_03095 [Thermoplasmata archaeon]|nr:hypothetical protein [Thermoplasmata archaeon]
MEFKPSIKYLISLLIPNIGEAEAKKLVRDAIYSAEVYPKQTNYEYDEFIRICEEIIKGGGRAKMAGLTAVTQARCSHTLKGLAKVTKVPTL